MRKISLFMVVFLAGLFVFDGARAQTAQSINDAASNLHASATYRAFSQAGCWSCPAVGILYQSSIALGKTFSEKIRSPLAKLLGMALGVWLLWNVLKIMMPFGGAQPGEVFNKIASKLMLYVFVLAFLTQAGYGLIWNYFIIPIYTTGINLSTSLLSSSYEMVSGPNSTTGMQAVGWLYSLVNATSFDVNTAITGGTRTGSCNPLDYNDFSWVNQYVPENAEEIGNAGKKLMCMAYDIQKIYGLGAALGLYSVAIAGTDFAANLPMTTYWGVRMPDWSKAMSFISKIIYLLVFGIILAIIYIIAIIIYPLFLLDAFFKIGIIAVLGPIFIACYLLEITRGWAIKALKTLVGVSATLVFQSLLISMSLAMVVATFQTIAKQVGASSSGDGAANFDRLAASLVSANLSAAPTIAVSFIIAGALGLWMMKSANKFANEFVGASAGSELGQAAIAAGSAIYKAAVTVATIAATAGAGAAVAGAGAAGAAGGSASAAGAGGGGSGGGLGGGLGNAGGVFGSPGGGGGMGQFAPQGVLNPQNMGGGTGKSPASPAPGGGTGGGPTTVSGNITATGGVTALGPVNVAGGAGGNGMQTAASKAAETAKAIGVGIVGPDLVQPAATTPTPQQGFGAPGPVGGQGAPGMTGAPGAAGSTGAAGAPGAGGLFTAPGTSQTISSPAIDSISRGGSGSASFASPTVTMPNYSASDFSNATTSNQELAKMAADLASKKPPEPKK